VSMQRREGGDGGRGMPPTPGAGAWRDARLVRAHVGGTRGLVFGADCRGNRENRCVGRWRTLLLPTTGSGSRLRLNVSFNFTHEVRPFSATRTIAELARVTDENGEYIRLLWGRHARWRGSSHPPRADAEHVAGNHLGQTRQAFPGCGAWAVPRRTASQMASAIKACAGSPCCAAAVSRLLRRSLLQRLLQRALSTAELVHLRHERLTARSDGIGT
jgi:hypothetical protein